jgi:hypothetical protein
MARRLAAGDGPWVCGTGRPRGDNGSMLVALVPHTAECARTHQNSKLSSTINTTETTMDIRIIARHPQPPPTGRNVTRRRFCVNDCLWVPSSQVVVEPWPTPSGTCPPESETTRDVFV